MTQEEKDILIKDLCGRLPYGVKATTTSNGWRDVYVVSGYNNDRIYLDCPVYDEGDDEWLIESIKPYLRPMSSMTEKEYREWHYLYLPSPNDEIIETKRRIDWLNSHHFDYRGLIPKGLALPAPEGMYIIK